MSEKNGSSPVEFHKGNALVLLAATYQTLSDVVFELVQNALDKGASHIRVALDFLKRNLTVEDDGDGVSRDEFEEALSSVAHSTKRPTDLGRFGIGLVCPIGKCDRFTFTSTPKNDPRSYVQWTFETGVIKDAESPNIPFRLLKELCFSREQGGKSGVPWRTQVRLMSFTKDRALTRTSVLSLREGILDKYSLAMKRHRTVVDIFLRDRDGKVIEDRFTADQFTGKRIPIRTVSGNDGNTITFRLFLANKTAQGRHGKVLIGESSNDFRISFPSFAQHANLLAPEVNNALSSGLFEGEILSSGIRIDARRSHFQVSDALVEMCVAIEEWYSQVGVSYVDQAREEKEDQRYQQLGRRSMLVIEGLLLDPQFAHLKDVIKSFGKGTIGDGHAKPDARIVGSDEGRSLSIDGVAGGAAERTRKGTGHQDAPKTEHLNHVPLTVAGPHGRRRTLVRGNSEGLQFLYEEMEGSERLWVLDTACGVLRFNTRHPLWAACEVDDKVIMRFQEHVAIIALTLELSPSEWKERNRQMADEMLPSFAFLLLRGDDLAGRKPGRKKEGIKALCAKAS